jgi:hypothetical protein
MFGFFGLSGPAARVAEIETQFPMPEAEIRRLKARRWILDWVPKGGVGAEIGVFRGHFSALICEVLAPKRLYLVDPWTLEGETYAWGGAYTNKGKLPTALAREQTLARVQAFAKTEAVVLENYFPDCAAQIPEPLDFAYLDAGHRFDSTLAELRALSGMIRPGGIIFGDDWRPKPTAVHHAVYRAVQRFLNESDWELMVAGPAGQWAICRRADRLLPGALD